MNSLARACRPAASALVAAVLLLAVPGASQAAPTSTFAAASAALQVSADLGHGEKVSAAASAPGGPIVPEGCRNFGHWVSSEARGTTCEDNPRPGGPKGDRGPKEPGGPKGDRGPKEPGGPKGR